MSPRVRRTLAIVAILVIAAVVIVVWRTPLATKAPASEAVPAESNRPEPVALSNGLRAPGPDVASTVLAVPGEPREARTDESDTAQPKVWVDLTVHVTTPTGPLDEGDKQYCAQIRSRLFDRYGNERGSRLRNEECSFRGLRPGRVVFSFLAPGFKPLERWITLRPEEPVHREEVVLDPAWTLKVHLTTGRGGFLSELRNALNPPGWLQLNWPLAIVASVDPPGQATEMKHVMRNQWILHAYTDDHKLDLVDDPPVHVSVFLGTQLLATQRLDTRVEEVTFAIPVDQLRANLSNLECTIVDQYTAGPIEGVKAMLLTADGIQAQVESDAQGLVRFPPQAPDVYRLDFDWEKQFVTSRTVKLEPGKDVNLGSIQLSTGVEISGRFSDGDEKPDRIWSASIVSDDSNEDAPSLCGLPRPIQVSLDGRFKTWARAAGRYVLKAMSHQALPDERVGRIYGVSKAVVVDTRNGKVQDLMIRMEDPVYLSIRPTFPDYDDYEFVLRNADGLHIMSSHFGGFTAHVAPGSYVLTLVRGREVLTKIPFTAASGSFVLDVP